MSDRRLWKVEDPVGTATASTAWSVVTLGVWVTVGSGRAKVHEASATASTAWSVVCETVGCGRPKVQATAPASTAWSTEGTAKVVTFWKPD